MLLHPKYLPFSEEQLRSHFAAVKQKKEEVSNAEKHIEGYKKSIERYDDFLSKHPDRKGMSLKYLRGPCQIEKDEVFWTASCLMTVIYDEDRLRQFIELLEKAYEPKPPVAIESWEECLNGDLSLFFEPNLPSPQSYKAWLRLNLRERQFIPHILDSANKKTYVEGATNVDAMLINSSNGFAVVIEAKVLSDISYQVTYDVMRNQIARNIDVMLESNPGLCHPLNTRDPEKTLFLLLTPRIFKDNSSTRLYGYKLEEYKSNPSSLEQDLPHRTGIDWNSISDRVGWLTWEDFKEVNQDCCRWLEE